MQPHNVRRARGQAIAFLLVVALSVAAVVIVLRPGGPLNSRLAGNSEYSQILGYAPGAALARLVLERGARATAAPAPPRGARTPGGGGGGARAAPLTPRDTPSPRRPRRDRGRLVQRARRGR